MPWEASAIYQHFPDGSEYCELEEGKDYFTHEWKTKPDIIITNPPFKLALEFLQKSLQEADVCIYLLRLGFFVALAIVACTLVGLFTYLVVAALAE